MRIGDQTGYKIFDEYGKLLNIPTEYMTVSDLVQFVQLMIGKPVFTDVKSEKEIWLWSEYGFSNNPTSKVLYKLTGNPKSCCG